MSQVRGVEPRTTYSWPLLELSLCTSSLSFLSVACSLSGYLSDLTLESVLSFPPLLARAMDEVKVRTDGEPAMRCLRAG